MHKIKVFYNTAERSWLVAEHPSRNPHELTIRGKFSTRRQANRAAQLLREYYQNQLDARNRRGEYE